MQQITCVICPKGCTIKTEDKIHYVGHQCERGLEYAIAEFTAPVRVVTTTVSISGSDYQRLPVKSTQPLPKALMCDAVKQLSSLKLSAPISIGDIIWSGTVDGVDIAFKATASRDSDK